MGKPFKWRAQGLSKPPKIEHYKREFFGPNKYPRDFSGVCGVDYLGYHPKGTTIFPMIEESTTAG